MSGNSRIFTESLIESMIKELSPDIQKPAFYAKQEWILTTSICGLTLFYGKHTDTATNSWFSNFIKNDKKGQND